MSVWHVSVAFTCVYVSRTNTYVATQIAPMFCVLQNVTTRPTTLTLTSAVRTLCTRRLDSTTAAWASCTTREKGSVGSER